MCPSLELLSSYLDGELEEPRLITIEKHLQICMKCTKRLSGFQKITQTLLEAMEPDVNAAQSLIERRLELFSSNRNQFFTFWRVLFKKANSVQIVSFFLSVVFIFGFWFFVFDEIELKDFAPSHFQSRVEIKDENGLITSFNNKQNLIIQLPSESVFIQFSEPLILREDELIDY